MIADGPEQPAAWAANVWRQPVRIAVASIGDAAKRLRAIQRNWALYDFAHHRRAALIEAKLPVVRPKPLVFPAPPPAAPLGSWTLLAPDQILAAATCSSPFRHGEAAFVEDKAGPPNRAYLKLWEALTVWGEHPGAADRCLDLGASPGGWTWVLLGLGARVIAVDKAPLDPRIMANPLLSWRHDSAFALAPEPVDWLFSDVVCYPARLLRLIETWIAARAARRIVATVKFQGETDLAAQRAFQAIPGGQLRHLHHNKHELTFFWRASGAAAKSL